MYLHQIIAFCQHRQHFLAVVFIHLAAKGADKYFFHGLHSFFQVARNCGADVFNKARIITNNAAKIK